MPFKQYDKELGFYIGESDLPSDNPDWGNTDVDLPGEIGQGYIFVFDENIQMWRSLNESQWQDYLAEKMTRLPDDDEQFKAMVTGQLVSLSKSVVSATTQLMLTTRSVTELQTQVKQLTEAKEEAQHV
ncbi:hypothetical protein D3P96_03020 [Weissella viridescens]|uniref:Uncharacterized protein n=1 Tax=Weissella viridescens TaxID=1629 RepID=A0A3P2RG70_WEIVI|nr:hypothetical protein [Weissella viridescens]RRG18271.1 hypothetical protein D3P96_03020 [Weissella viridescens]